MRYYLTLLTLISSLVSYGQKKTASVEGKVVDSDNRPISGASILILGRQTGISSNDTGYFKIYVPADRAFTLVFSYTGYISQQRNLLLNENETERIVVSLERGSGTLESVTVNNSRDRKEAGLIVINPKNSINIPSPVGGIENMIKVIVGSNNELSSQYSVRGGNYDENLIYVNDFEVFRPYLVRSGQQEGLSFINPELAKNVNFYNGGFQAKYGDKMSSVLDVQYRKPKSFGGSVYLGLLEQGVHLEGSSLNDKFSFLIGARNRSNRNLLSSQQTQGNYVPSSSDLQGLLNYKINRKNSIELLGNLSGTTFKLTPQFSQLTSSVFSPFFTSNLGLDIYFEGREADNYKTNMIGLSLIQQPRKDLRLKWMSSYFSNKEIESFDIAGAYLFGEREFDKTQSDFGMITNPLGAGLYQNYARNKLKISVLNVSHKGSLTRKKHFIQWGQIIEQQKISDRLYEWEYQDSAGYNLPYNPDQVILSRFTGSSANLDITRLTGYLQDNIIWNDSTGLNVMAGIRYNYNTLNKELLVSPRIGFSYVPQKWEKDIVFRGAFGLYQQPPFYRELRRFDGSVNENLQAQKSIQFTGGLDYSFSWNNRPFRITTEAYYKKMWDNVPYDIDNVRLRYYGENSAKAYAMGIEGRLYGELVKDAESWISIGFMRTRENLNGDTYYNYTLDSLNKPVDSNLVDAGWLRRPTDRLINMGVFLQDYLSTNKNFKVYLNLLYGSNIPYNIPNSVKYRNGLIIDPYIRIDLGFSALLLDSEKTNRRSHHPFRNFENIWATLEVFNVIDRSNTISFLLVKDYSNTVFAMPNRLTPRLINLKLIGRF